MAVQVTECSELTTAHCGSLSGMSFRHGLPNVTLYVQKDYKDLPLPETAECLAADAFLRICGLDFSVCENQNAAYMSPSGRAPFVKCGTFIFSEMDQIARYLSCLGLSGSSRLCRGELSLLRALSALLSLSLSAAEVRVCWLHDTTRHVLTAPGVAGRYPWPLNRLVAAQRRRRALDWLRVSCDSDVSFFSLEHLYLQVDRVCGALSAQLGDAAFYFGDGATELEALVYGHLYMLLTVPVPLGESPLSKIVCQYPNLLSLVSRLDDTLYNRSTAFWLVESPDVVLPVLIPSTQDLSTQYSDASTCTADDVDDRQNDRETGGCPGCVKSMPALHSSNVSLTNKYSDASTCTREDKHPELHLRRTKSDTGPGWTVCGTRTVGSTVPLRELMGGAGHEHAEEMKLTALLQMTAALVLLVALNALERVL